MNFIMLVISIIFICIMFATSFFAKKVWIPILFSFLSGIALGIGFNGVPKGLILGTVLGILYTTSIVLGGRVVRKSSLKNLDKDKK